MSLSLGRNCFDSHVAVGSLQAERTLRPKLVPETCQCQQHTELPDEVELKVDGDSVEEPEEEPKWEPHSQSMAGQVKFNEGCLFEPPFVCACHPCCHAAAIQTVTVPSTCQIAQALVTHRSVCFPSSYLCLRSTCRAFSHLFMLV